MFFGLEIKSPNYKIVFKICCKSYFKYLRIELITRYSFVESIGGFRELEDLSISLSLLKALELASDKFEKAMEYMIFFEYL